MELTRVNARLLPLNGKAFEEEYNKVLAETRAPLNFEKLEAREKAALQKMIAEIDVIIDKYNNPHFAGRRSEWMSNHLATMLVKSLYQDLPENERPNAETFVAMREQIMKQPEFGTAVKWYENHLEDLKELSQGIINGIGHTQIIQRLNEASVKQQTAAKMPAPCANLLFRLQLINMKAQRSKYWKRCGAESEWKEGVKEQFREDFLDFTAMNALIEAHPDRLFFSKEEIRAARLPFEQNPEFVEKMEAAILSPTVARNKICGFSNDNFWTWTQQSFVQMDGVQAMSKRNKVSPMVKMQMTEPVAGNLAQAAVSKLYLDIYYEPSSRVLMQHQEDLLDTPGFRAMVYAFMDDPSQLERVVFEVFHLEGEAFRAGLEKIGQEYLKKYLQAGQDAVNAAAERAKIRTSRKAQKPAPQDVKPSSEQGKTANDAKEPVNGQKKDVPKQSEPKKEGLKQNEPKKDVPKAEPQNRINIINEPKNAAEPDKIRFSDEPEQEEPLNRINEPRIPQSAVSKLKPEIYAVPDKGEKDSTRGQFQSTAAMLEKTLQMREYSKIPADNPEFVDTAYQGTLQTLAYLNLSERKEFFKQKAGKDALSAEMERLKADKNLQPLKNAIRSGYGKTILDGIKHMHNDPKELQGFLRRMGTDPAGTKKLLEQKFQRPAPRFTFTPLLPKTNAVNDVIPKPVNGQTFDPNSPAGRYYKELQAYETVLDTVKNYGVGGIGGHYDLEVEYSIVRLYGLTQIMANSKDPTAPVKDLEAQLKHKCIELGQNPGGLKPLCEGSQQNTAFRDHVLERFKTIDSVSKLNERLQSDADKVVRRAAEKENDRIIKSNGRIIREALNDKEKNRNPEI